MTYRCEKLWSAPPWPLLRPSGRIRRRKLCVMTIRRVELRCTPSGPRHRPPGTPRRRPICVMTYRHQKLWSIPPRPGHRPPRRPRRRTLYVMTYRHEKLWSAPPGPRHRSPQRRRTLCVPGHSTQTTVLKLREDIRAGIDNEKQLLTILLLFDFSKAVDTISPTKLLHKLIRMEFSRGVVLWIKSYITGRNQKVITKQNWDSDWLTISAYHRARFWDPFCSVSI